MKKIIMIMCLSFILCGCNTKGNTNDMNNIIKEDNYVIIDVRTEEEFDELHIQGAINIPYDEISEDINIDRSKTIYVYCRSGNRSNKAYNTLVKLGYNVKDLGALKDIDLPKEKK